MIFLIVSEDFQECSKLLYKLIKLLRKLGFSVNYNKNEGPSWRLTYLGLVMTIELLQKTLAKFKEDLQMFRNSKKTSN